MTHPPPPNAAHRARPVVLRYPLLVLAAAIALAALVLWASGLADGAPWLAAGYAATMAVRAAWSTVRTLRAGSFGVDLLAVIAVVSALAVGEWWAAFVVGVMLATGEALEDYAAHRARRDLRALAQRAPTRAVRIDETGESEDVAVGEIRPGEVILVRSGELVPVDAVLLAERGSFDESSLTGEPVPREAQRGDEIPSGAVNGASSVPLRALRPAAASQYQQIVALVEEASRTRAPMVRLADRVAIPFTVGALLLAGAAWVLSGDPTRFAEVLVVATPCPLIIAAPVAFVAGMSRGAREGVVMKTGAALEQLSRARTVAFDKTGTLTRGAPQVVDVRAAPGATPRQVLQWAAAAEQTSPHVTAQAIVAAARARDAVLPIPDRAQDVPGDGVTAVVEGRVVVVGKRSFVQSATAEPLAEFAPGEAGEVPVFVSVDARPVGVLVLRDDARPEAREVVAALRSAAAAPELLMVSGDERAAAERVAQALGIVDVHAPCTPAEKVAVVAAAGRPVVMVGDGVNDAPVLAAADVGVAMGAAGATAASESADIVLLVDDLRALLRARDVARRTVRVAVQSMGIGLGLSLGLMVFAAFGGLPALVGAWLQEAVDLVSILWALRAATSGVSGASSRDDAGARPGRGTAHTRRTQS